MNKNSLIVETHSHTYFSKRHAVPFDGIHSPEQMVDQAQKLGINALFITDHDKIEGALRAQKYAVGKNVQVFVGEEISTKAKGLGHLLGLGLNERIKPGLGVDESIDLIHSQGGIAIAPHPFDVKNEGIQFEAIASDAIESFNAINIDRFSNWRAKKFAEKNNLTALSGSDAHTIHMMGYGANKVFANNNLDSILKAIQKGKVEGRNSYTPFFAYQDWVLSRLQLSKFDILHYVEENYGFLRKNFSKNMLKLVDHSPGKADPLIDFLSVLGVSGIVTYSGLKSVRNIRKLY
ncbi:MAG: PHP domain-containing protein [archaeon]|nr:PHP domain-containing protein [archaeon]